MTHDVRMRYLLANNLFPVVTLASLLEHRDRCFVSTSLAADTILKSSILFRSTLYL